MMLRRRHRGVDDEGDVIVEHGPSLAKGPALVAGAILVAFGLAGLLKNNDFPSFSSAFPDGEAQGTNLLGIEVNGWTCFFSITAGALLLFGAAQHHLAKLMSLIVGLALAACAVIAVIDGQDVLGLAAANAWTKLGFAVAGGAMLVNALMPRVTRRREVATTASTDRDVVDPVADDAPHRRRFGRPRPTAGDEVEEPRTTVVDRDPARDDEPVRDDPATTPHHRV